MQDPVAVLLTFQVVLSKYFFCTAIATTLSFCFETLQACQLVRGMPPHKTVSFFQ